MSLNYKKYDLVTLELDKGTIKNCLIYSVNSEGISVYPIEKFIQEIEYPRAIAKIFIPYKRIVKHQLEDHKLLFYAVNTKHPFILEALEYYMNHESKSRKNKKNSLQ